MTIEEIFVKLTNHMLEGVMIHEQFISYYQFLGLDGYSKCHEKHFKSESKNYRNIYNYYIKTYNKLLPASQFPQPEIIPSSWLQYTRQDVDAKTKRQAIQQGLDRWVKWERATYEFYHEVYNGLIQNKAYYDAEQVLQLMKDVKCELGSIEQYQLDKISTNYDIVEIINEQNKKDKLI